jgi:hypothetical protein
MATADTNWVKSTTFWSEANHTPVNDVPGSIGDAIYYPAVDGPSKDTQTLTFDSIILLTSLKNYKAAINTFNTAKSAYDTKKTAYDTAVDKFTKREADFFAKAFTPEEKLPTRPDAPARPSPYTLPNFGLAAAAAATPFTWKTTATAQGNTAHLSVLTAASTYAKDPSPIAANKRSFLSATTDDAAFAADNYKYAGHVFGLMGQGLATMPGNAPFYWGTTATADKASMLVSIMPLTDADVGLDTAAKFITLSAKGAAWAKLDDFNTPALPDAPAAPKADPRAGAASIAVGLMASLAVVSTLY